MSRKPMGFENAPVVAQGNMYKGAPDPATKALGATQQDPPARPCSIGNGYKCDNSCSRPIMSSHDFLQEGVPPGLTGKALQ